MNNYYCVWFFTRAHITIFCLTFLIIGPHIHLYTWSTQQVTVAQHMCWFFKASNPTKFFSIKCLNLTFNLNFNLRADGFPFPSIYGPPYPTFQFQFVLLLFDVLLALLLVGGMSHLCIIYNNLMRWSTHSSWSCWILLGVWHGRFLRRVDPLGNIVLMSYGKHTFWILSVRPST